MGGLVMWLGLIVATLSFSRGDLQFIWLSLSATVGFGLIGLMDDLIIVLRKRSMGLRAYQKFIGQIGIALIVALFAYNNPLIGSKLIVPFGGGFELDLYGWYVPFTVFVVVSMVNGVNLTDGLDGLATGVTMINALTYTIILFICYQIQSGAGMALESGGHQQHDDILGIADGRMPSRSCASTHIPPRCSWATPARWRWAPRCQ